MNRYDWWKEMLKLTVVVIFAVAVVMLVGCAALPENMQDCEISPYVQQWETVEDCKMAVLHREDSQYERATQEIENERYARRCYVLGGVWDKRLID